MLALALLLTLTRSAWPLSAAAGADALLLALNGHWKVRRLGLALVLLLLAVVPGRARWPAGVCSRARI